MPCGEKMINMMYGWDLFFYNAQFSLSRYLRSRAWPTQGQLSSSPGPKTWICFLDYFGGFWDLSQLLLSHNAHCALHKTWHFQWINRQRGRIVFTEDLIGCNGAYIVLETTEVAGAWLQISKRKMRTFIGTFVQVYPCHTNAFVRKAVSWIFAAFPARSWAF